MFMKSNVPKVTRYHLRHMDVRRVPAYKGFKSVDVKVGVFARHSLKLTGELQEIEVVLDKWQRYQRKHVPTAPYYNPNCIEYYGKMTTGEVLLGLSLQVLGLGVMGLTFVGRRFIGPAGIFYRALTFGAIGIKMSELPFNLYNSRRESGKNIYNYIKLSPDERKVFTVDNWV